MDEAIQELKEVGAQRIRLRAELADAEAALRRVMPTAKALLTQEAIRRLTGLSIPTIRSYTR